MGGDVDEVRATWERVSDAWDRHADALATFTSPIRDALVAALDPRPDDVVLELAAGTGGLSRALAPQVREVVCTDIAPGMVAAAVRRAEAEAVANVRCQVADAHDLPFGDDAFDAVVCQLGLMLMPDPRAALSEVHRVLRDGGRIAVATWGAAEDNLWIVMIGAALLQHGHVVGRDPTGPGGIFSMSTPSALDDVLSAAGFRDVEVAAVPVRASFDRFADYWDRHTATGGALRGAVDGLDPDEAAAVRDTCEAACEGFRDGSGYTFTGGALVAHGRT